MYEETYSVVLWHACVLCELMPHRELPCCVLRIAMARGWCVFRLMNVEGVDIDGVYRGLDTRTIVDYPNS